MVAAVDVDALVATGFGLDGGRRLIPEPAVKAALRALGVPVPAGVTATDPAQLAGVAAHLEPPLVLKAYGAGLVHKSELGAVVLDVDHAALAGAAAAMRDRLTGAGLTCTGFLVETQVGPGVEVLVGVVRRPSFGALVTVGLGGTAAELLGDVATRLAPLDERDADDLLGGFRGAALLRGARGGAPVDHDALVRLLLAIAGHGGLAEQLGDRLDELECNPVVATPSGVCALDARLLLGSPAAADRPGDLAPAELGRLFAPRTIAIAGASTTKNTFGNRAIAAYRDMGWTDGLYALHPSAKEVGGAPAVADIAALPGGEVDVLLVAVPAAACVDVLARQGGRARIAQVVTAGFAEAGSAGASLEAQLVRAARDAGIRFLGPNCIGTYAPAGRQTFQLDAPRAVGSVGVVSQSGGLAGDLVKLGARHGVRFSKVVSVGNAIDVGPGEVVEHLVDDPETAVLGLYLEGPRDGARLVAALRRAAGRKPVVALVGGRVGAGAGADAVRSHTGSLTGDERLWDAVARATGLSIVDTLEHLVAALVFLQRYATATPASASPAPAVAPTAGGVLLVGVGGGASVLAADACGRAGLDVTPVLPAVAAGLRDMGYGAGTSVANPIEVGIGPLAPPDEANRVLDAVLAGQPYDDVLVHVNVQAYSSYGTAGVTPLCELLAALGAASWGRTRLCVVTRNLDVVSGSDRDAILVAAAASAVPTYGTFDEATVAIAAGQRFARSRACP